MTEKEKFRIIGTKHGIVDTWFKRNSLFNQINIWMLVRKDLVCSGQGCKRCNCTKMCKSNRCKCLKTNYVCNSAHAESSCHNTLWLFLQINKGKLNNCLLYEMSNSAAYFAISNQIKSKFRRNWLIDSKNRVTCITLCIHVCRRSCPSLWTFYQYIQVIYYQYILEQSGLPQGFTFHIPLKLREDTAKYS